MKFIDKETGKRILTEEEKEFKDKIKKEEPVVAKADKGDMEECSPMDPPDAYDPEMVVEVNYDEMHSGLKELLNEHKEAEPIINAFEEALKEFKKEGFYISKEINDAFNQFFVYFDEEILKHNRTEERTLFPILHKRMLETGEHSEGPNPHTPIDLMEDEHVKFIQLATLSFNMLGLAMRLRDVEARAMTFDLAYNNAMELVETLRLHIYKEDHVIFPLAQKLLSKEELEQCYGK